MEFGYDGRLFVLAFDHRGSFKTKMFGIGGREETPEETERLREAKSLVWEGYLSAAESGLPDGAGVLVDEEMGADVARAAKERGVTLAMPVECSGQPVFDFEYGDEFGDHIEAFDPDFAKVLVRWNPDDSDPIKAVQSDRLKRLSDWLHESDRRLLFELLVPASERQMEAVGGDGAAYDTHVRPILMLRVIQEILDAGIEPDVWKIEGIDATEHCALVADLTMAGGREGVKSVVLGRGADDAKVDHWLRQGAPVPGYAGFAIGRSIWWDGVAAWKDGSMERSAAAAAIGEGYRRFIDVYTGAV